MALGPGSERDHCLATVWVAYWFQNWELHISGYSQRRTEVILLWSIPICSPTEKPWSNNTASRKQKKLDGFFFFSITLKWWGCERSTNRSKCQTWQLSFKNALLPMPTTRTGCTMLLLQQRRAEVPDHFQNKHDTFKRNRKQYKARPISVHSLQKANGSTLLWMNISYPSLLAAVSMGQTQPGLFVVSYNLDCSC